MHQIYKLPLILITTLFFSNCAGTYQQRSTIFSEKNLARQIDGQIGPPELETALVDIMVQSAKTGEIFNQHNAITLIMPVSNKKIPTSASGLVRLGPDFRYQTLVYTIGEIEDGILKGNLIIIASVDPTFSSRFCENKADCFVFQAWADSLRAKGIYAIEGNIIGIDDVFDDEPYGYGWSVNNPGSSSATKISSVIYNKNIARIIIKADSLGKYMNIKIIHNLGYLKIEPDLGINPDETENSMDRIPETNTIQITDKIRPGDRYIENVSIYDPMLHFLSALKCELVLLGIPVYEQPIDADVLIKKEKLSQKKLLLIHSSAAFKEVVKILMKESQNLYAESLVKLMGSHFGKEGSF